MILLISLASLASFPLAAATQDTGASEAIKVTGRVLTPDGEPALGTRVQLGGDLVPRDARSHTRVEHPSGRFSLDSPDVGRVELVAVHEDFGAARAQINPSRSETLQLQLDPRYLATVRIEGPEGPPSYSVEMIVGHIWSAHSPVSRFPHFKPEEIPAYARDESLWASGRLRIGEEPFPTLTLRLRPGRPLAGQVRGLPSEHLPRLRVKAWPETWPREVRARVEPTGSFYFDSLPPGHVGITLSVLETAYEQRRSVRIPDEGALPDLKVDFGGRHAIDITLLAGGSPIAEASARLFGSRNRLHTLRTDSRGRLREEGLPEGSYRLVVAVSGVDVERRLEIPAGAARSFDIPVSELRGRVLDAYGAPLDKAEVALQGPVQASRTFHPLARTQASGAFSFGGVPKEGRIRLAAFKQGFAVAQAVLPPGERQPLDIRLQPSREVALKVRDWRGKIPDELGVIHLSEEGGFLRRLALEPSGEVFRLDGLPEGPSRLLAGTADSALQRLNVRPGRTASLELQPAAAIKVRIPWLPEGAVSFRLSGPQGPRPGFLRWIPQAAGDGWITWSGPVTQQIGSLASGRWTVTARWPDGSETRTSTHLDPGETVRLELSRGEPNRQ